MTICILRDCNCTSLLQFEQYALIACNFWQHMLPVPQMYENCNDCAYVTNFATALFDAIKYFIPHVLSSFAIVICNRISLIAQIVFTLCLQKCCYFLLQFHVVFFRLQMKSDMQSSCDESSEQSSSIVQTEVDPSISAMSEMMQSKEKIETCSFGWKLKVQNIPGEVCLRSGRRIKSFGICHELNFNPKVVDCCGNIYSYERKGRRPAFRCSSCGRKKSKGSGDEDGRSVPLSFPQ